MPYRPLAGQRGVCDRRLSRVRPQVRSRLRRLVRAQSPAETRCCSHCGHPSVGRFGRCQSGIANLSVSGISKAPSSERIVFCLAGGLRAPTCYLGRSLEHFGSARERSQCGGMADPFIGGGRDVWASTAMLEATRAERARHAASCRDAAGAIAAAAARRGLAPMAPLGRVAALRAALTRLGLDDGELASEETLAAALGDWALQHADRNVADDGPHIGAPATRTTSDLLARRGPASTCARRRFSADAP